MPGALQDVNAMIGVAGVDKDLLVLFVLVIYLVPIERQVISERRSRVYRLRVAQTASSTTLSPTRTDQ